MQKVTSSGESGSRGCKGGTILVVWRTPLAVEGAKGACDSVGCTDMLWYDKFLVRDLEKIGTNCYACKERETEARLGRNSV